MSDTIKLEDLRPQEGSTHKDKRKGRGRASGHGKTSCRGHNGEGQRSGRSAKRGFEGGQMPSYRQMPKLKGFSLVNQINYAEVNVRDFDRWNLKEVDLEILVKAGRVHPSSQKLRVLGNGELTNAVVVKADYFTPSAKEKIENAGGKAELV